MRVIHAHHYEGIILDLLWDAIKVDVPELKKYVEKIGLKEGNSEIIFEDTSNDDNKYKLFYDILNN